MKMKEKASDNDDKTSNEAEDKKKGDKGELFLCSQLEEFYIMNPCSLVPSSVLFTRDPTSCHVVPRDVRILQTGEGTR